MIILTLILLSVFITNIIIYWLIYLKIKNKEKGIIKFYYKIFPRIWIISIVPIPIINSSFLILLFPNNISYFQYYWIYFVLFGITFIVLGVFFAKKARKEYKIKSYDESETKLITSGVYRIVRHPIYLSWVIIFLGVAIISDSFISLVVSLIFLIVLEIHAICEEKLILIPRYGNSYQNYIKKTPNRIIPTPLNFLLLIITFLIIYVGFLNIT
jgi:protein-S-isoprenylcysteine O-methyltransferase Ste14